MSGGIEETSASFEARSAPRSYPTGGTAEWLRDTLAQVSPPATIARAGGPIFTFLLAACGRCSGNSEAASRPVPIGSRSPGPCGAGSLQACPSLLFPHSAWDVRCALLQRITGNAVQRCKPLTEFLGRGFRFSGAVYQAERHIGSFRVKPRLF